MIIFCPELGIMLSDIYGMPGESELRTMAKKMRLDGSAIRSQGHPTEECYVVPPSKFDGMAARGAQIVSSKEVSTIRGEKVTSWAQKSLKKPKTYQKPADDTVFQEHFERNRQKDRNTRRFRAERRHMKESEDL